MLYFAIFYCASIAAYAFWLHFGHKAAMTKIYYGWESLAVEAERNAVHVEDTMPTAVGRQSLLNVDWHRDLANYYWHAAARYRVNAAKYIKYLPEHEQANATALNTSVGIAAYERENDNVQHIV